MNIAVLCGGLSTEREISIKSGYNVCKALRGKGHNAVLVDPYYNSNDASVFEKAESDYDIDVERYKLDSLTGDIYSYEIKGRPYFKLNVLFILEQADIVFNGLHGRYGEDGMVQAVLDLHAIKYTGSGHVASALGMDKGLTKQIFKGKGVPTPESVWLQEGDDYDLEKIGMDFPLVVKAKNGGSSVGVYIVNNEEEYKDAIYECYKIDDSVLIEEFINGREFSVGVVGDEVFPVVEIIPKDGWYDYTNKYEPGATEEVCPAELTTEQTLKMQTIAKEACDVLGCEVYARADIIMTENGDMYCLEVNTLPGMTETSLVPREAESLGISFADLCERIIELSFKKYEDKE
ncbi:MAG: D-alanine--D-alanine ligase [Eubacterium sp.]|nr:D-alanine--D-alanine ligase [Eubacterium sp.]